MDVRAKPNMEQEMESPEYKAEYERHLSILNSFLRAMVFIRLNCSRSADLKSKLFCLSVIDDLLQSLVAIKCLSDDGIRNSCRRELRYIIELSIKACFISQKESSKSTEEQIVEFRNALKSTNISMINDISFHFFDEPQKELFIAYTKRLYGMLCLYVHSSPQQMEERITLDKIGRSIGYEGTNELRELDDEISNVLLSVLVLFFHAIPQRCVGDYIVESNGYTTSTYYSKYKFFAIIDEYFDYKSARQDKLEELQKIRTANICY